MKAYADTNFFTRLYLKLGDSKPVNDLLENAKLAKSDNLPATWLTEFELTNALWRCVYVSRMEKQFRVTNEMAMVAHATFHEDLVKQDYVEPVPLPHSALNSVFEDLVFRHTAKHGFRVYDVLHVASALVLGCNTFWSFDIKAKHLATLEGLAVNG